MVGLPLDFLRNFLQPPAKRSEIALALLLSGWVVSQIKEQLWPVLALKFLRYRPLKVGHDLRKLVHLGFRPLIEISFEVLRPLDTARIERRHERVVMTLP